MEENPGPRRGKDQEKATREVKGKLEGNGSMKAKKRKCTGTIQCHKRANKTRIGKWLRRLQPEGNSRPYDNNGEEPRLWKNWTGFESRLGHLLGV